MNTEQSKKELEQAMLELALGRVFVEEVHTYLDPREQTVTKIEKIKKQIAPSAQLQIYLSRKYQVQGLQQKKSVFDWRNEKSMNGGGVLDADEVLFMRTTTAAGRKMYRLCSRREQEARSRASRQGTRSVLQQLGMAANDRSDKGARIRIGRVRPRGRQDRSRRACASYRAAG